MLHALPDHPSIARTLDEVTEALGENVLELDSPAALRSTVSVQLALLASGVAVARALLAEGGTPEAVAGMSAGAFAAAVVAGVLNLADGVRLLKLRAERMVELYPEGYGLAAIVGLRENELATLVEEAYTEQNPVYVGNINAPRQIVIVVPMKVWTKYWKLPESAAPVKQYDSLCPNPHTVRYFNPWRMP